MKFILLVLFTVASAAPLPDDDVKLYLSDRSIDDIRLSSVVYKREKVKDESLEVPNLSHDDDVYVTLSKPKHYVEVNKPVIKAPVFKQPIYEDITYEKPVLKAQIMKYEIKDARIPAPEKVEYESMKTSELSSGGDVFLTLTEPTRYVEVKKPVIKERVFKQPIYKETIHVEPVHKAPVIEYEIKEAKLPTPGVVEHKSMNIPDESSDDNVFVILSEPNHHHKVKKSIIEEPVFKQPLLEEIAYKRSVDETPLIQYEVVEERTFPAEFRTVPTSKAYSRPVVFKQSIYKED